MKFSLGDDPSVEYDSSSSESRDVVESDKRHNSPCNDVTAEVRDSISEFEEGSIRINNNGDDWGDDLLSFDNDVMTKDEDTNAVLEMRISKGDENNCVSPSGGCGIIPCSKCDLVRQFLATDIASAKKSAKSAGKQSKVNTKDGMEKMATHLKSLLNALTQIRNKDYACAEECDEFSL